MGKGEPQFFEIQREPFGSRVVSRIQRSLIRTEQLRISLYNSLARDRVEWPRTRFDQGERVKLSSKVFDLYFSRKTTGPIQGSCRLVIFHRRRSAMAVINRNSLVLNGVSVACDKVAGTMGNGVDAAVRWATAMPFPTRHPSHRFPQAMQEPGQQQRLADDCGGDSLAARVGRPGSSPCVLASSLARTGSRRSNGLRLGRLSTRYSRVSSDRSRWCSASSRRTLRPSIPTRLLARVHKRDEAEPGRFKPAGGTPPASTRGLDS